MRLLEFFEDGSGRLSMSRLILFFGFIALTAMMFKMPITPTSVGIYIAFITGTYSIGKGIDAITSAKNG